MSTTDETNDAEQNQNTDTESTTTYCQNCGEYVTPDYHRVFSDNDGVLHSCLNCTPKGTDRGGRQ